MSKNKRSEASLKLLKETETLFMCASPQQLRKSLHEVYAFYLQNLDITIIHPDFNSMAIDFYFLHHFLQKVEELEKGTK